MRKKDERNLYIKTKNSNFKIDLRKNNFFKDILNELLSRKKVCHSKILSFIKNFL